MSHLIRTAKSTILCPLCLPKFLEKLVEKAISPIGLKVIFGFSFKEDCRFAEYQGVCALFEFDSIGNEGPDF